MKRDGAKAGDYLVTTGPLGLAGAGLEVLQTGRSHFPWTSPLVGAFSRPQPRFAAGRILGRSHLATSLMDSSDGLEASVRILTEASGAGAEIELLQLPVPPALARWAKIKGRHPWDYALTGGEDYELVFTVNPFDWPRVKRLIPGATHIGRILPRVQGRWAVSPQGRIALKGYGFSHFK